MTMSQSVYQSVLNAVRDAIVLVDAGTSMIVEANPAAEALCGRSLAELRSLHYSQLHPPDGAEFVRCRLQGDTHVSGPTEGSILHKDGHRIPVEVSTSYLTGLDRQPIFVIVFRDITERITARDALLTSEERFRQVVENAGEFIWELDPDGLYLYANPVVEQILGYTPEELVGKLHPYDLLLPETRAEAQTAALEIMARQERFNAFLTWRVRKDGKLVALETSGTPFWDTDGAFMGYRGATRDVTERLRAEQALRQSEKIYRAIGESIDYGVWICAPDGRNTYTSEALLRLAGLTQEQCSNYGWGDVLHPDDAERTIAAWKECVRTEGKWDVEYRVRGSDGEWHPLLARGVPVRDQQGRITCWAGINLDIGELKRTQESLRVSESQAQARASELQAIMDAAPAAIFIAHDPECRHISGNRTAHEWLRVQPGINLSKSAVGGEIPTNFRMLRDGVEIPPWDLPIQQAVSTGKPVRNCEVETVFADGAASTHLMGNVEPLLDDDGRPRGAVAVLSDITERKHAEAALRESEERFRNMADTAPVLLWLSGTDKLCTFFNKPWLDFTGRTLKQELGNGWADGVHPDDLDRCLRIYSSSFDARRSFQMEYRLRRADREYRWVLDHGTPRYRRGEFIGFIGSCIDITDQKSIEEQLRANEVQLKEAQRLAKVGSWDFDLETGSSHWSDEMLRILGVRSNPPTGLSDFLSYVHPRDREKLLQSDSRIRSSLAPVDTEWRVIRPDGDVRFVHSVAIGIRNKRGAVVHIVGATQDITEQVESRDLLRESEDRLKNAERLAHLGHWQWDLQTNHVSWSDEMFRIFGKPTDYAPSYEDFLHSLTPENRERVARWVTDCLAQKSGGNIESQVTWPDGEVRTVACMSEVLPGEEGLPVRMFGACQDITERKEIEEMMRNSEQQLRALAGSLLTAQEDERRRLARELHDDITQQLAFLSIELGRLATEIPDSSENTQARVRALQAQTLQMSGEVRRLSHGLHPSVIEDFGLSIALEEFCREFGTSKAIDIRFGGSVDDSQLDTAGATCLYRVAQESLRNAVVHGHATEIRVELTAHAEAIHLRVQDNGTGFPTGGAPTKTGLGLISMRERIRFVHGKLTISSRPGQGVEIAASVPLAGVGYEANAHSTG